jgi:D-alanine-D-alanine ligase
LARKLRVGVIYGGRSGEHEVSIASAASICGNLDPARYDTVPIHIAKNGSWTLPGAAPKVLSAADVLKQGATQALQAIEPTTAVDGSRIDVVFPIVHGPYGEDGTLQGLLELAGVPYV